MIIKNINKYYSFIVAQSDLNLLDVCFKLFLSDGGRSPAEPPCRLVFESETESPPNRTSRRRSLVSSEPQHVTLIVFGVGMVNRTHLEADIGGLTMEAELKKIHGSFTLKEKMKGNAYRNFSTKALFFKLVTVYTLKHLLFSRYSSSENDRNVCISPYWWCEHCAFGGHYTRYPVSISYRFLLPLFFTLNLIINL